MHEWVMGKLVVDGLGPDDLFLFVVVVVVCVVDGVNWGGAENGSSELAILITL
jgi:hypothetical protein